MDTKRVKLSPKEQLKYDVQRARPQDFIAALAGVSLVQVIKVLKAMRTHSMVAGTLSQKVGVLEYLGEDPAVEGLYEPPSPSDEDACGDALRSVDQNSDMVPFTKKQVRDSFRDH